jgi:hypothetical protein
LLIAGLALLGTASVTALAVDFDPVGGSGDHQDTDRCPPGKYLAGVRFRSGSWMDQITIACAPMDASGTVGASDFPFPAKGGGGGGADEAFCKGNQIVFGMNYTLTINNQVRHITFNCGTKTLDKYHELSFGGNDQGAHNSATHPFQSCGPAGNGQAATGLKINWGNHVNALGLLCGPLPKAPPKPAADQIKGTNADFAGTWDTKVPDSNAKYLLTLSINGNTVTGDFVNQQDPKYNGTLSGTAINGRLAYTYTQPQVNGSGRGFFIVSAGNTIAGFTYSSDQPKKAHGWEGRRVKLTGKPKPPATPPPAAPPPGKAATALVGTTVYQNHTDENPPKVCAMRPNDTGTLLETAPDNPLWLHLTAITGGCNGKSGWVWKGDQGEDVSVK